MKKTSIAEMLEAGVHFGHQPSRWHPNMKPFVFTVRNGVHIIDLERTKEQLERAFGFLEDQAKKGKNVLFVGTKRQSKDIVRKKAQEAGVPFLVERWVGGFLTNFNTVSKSIDRLRQLKKQRDTGELKKYTKKEQLNFEREIEKLESIFGGVEEMRKAPEVVVIMSAREEKTALREAKRMGIPIVAVCDTNVNPEGITHPIAANDDAIKAIEFIAGYLCGAAASGSAQKPVVAGDAAKKPAAKPAAPAKDETPAPEKAEDKK